MELYKCNIDVWGQTPLSNLTLPKAICNTTDNICFIDLCLREKALSHDSKEPYGFCSFNMKTHFELDGEHMNTFMNCISLGSHDRKVYYDCRCEKVSTDISLFYNNKNEDIDKSDDDNIVSSSFSSADERNKSDTSSNNNSILLILFLLIFLF